MGGLDAISGYVVEYGGWDYTDIDLDLNNDGDTNDANEIDEDTKICYCKSNYSKS